MDFCIRSFPRSMRRARLTSPSRVRQRNGAHFAQIHAYRIVGVNRLFGLLGRELLFLNFLGMEEIGFFVERKSEGFVTLC